jgi:hypothetical protein
MGPSPGPLPPVHRAIFSKKSVFKNKPATARSTVSGPVRSVRRSGRNRIGELLDSSGDPAPGIGTVVIAGECKLVGASGAFLKRSLAVALEDELRRPPNVDLGYHDGKAALALSIKV